MSAGLNRLRQSWIKAPLKARLGQFAAILLLSSVPIAFGGERPLSTGEFNNLPNVYRIGYLMSGPSKRQLDSTAKVDDLVDDLLLMAGNSDNLDEKRGLALALVTVFEVSSRNEEVVKQCKMLADELFDSKFSLTAVDVYFFLLGDESRPYLIEALMHTNSRVRVQAAVRMGRGVGKVEDIPELEKALTSAEGSGNQTVARYIKEAIASIKSRGSGNGVKDEGIKGPGHGGKSTGGDKEEGSCEND